LGGGGQERGKSVKKLWLWNSEVAEKIREKQLHIGSGNQQDERKTMRFTGR